MSPRTRTLLAVGALLGAIGWWLPWLGARSGAAGLVLLGLDLGEFLRFTTSWAAGLIAVERDSFFVPPVLAALLLALALARTSWRARALAALPLLWLTLVPLPAIDQEVLPLLRALPGALSDEARMAEYGVRLAISLGGAFGVAALLVVGRRIPARAWAATVLLVALLGLVPLWALWRVWPLVQGLYGGATLGLGAFVSGLGFTLAALAACRALLFSRK